MTVKKFDGVSWEFVGYQGFSEGEIQFPQMDFDSNDIPYVSYMDWANGQKISVDRFVGMNGKP